MNMLIKEVDENFGFIKEDECYNILKAFFDNTLQKVDNRYNLFDFIGEECYMELKSRRNTHNKYPDTMIGCNKIEFAMKTYKTIIFCFLFTDGLFYYKFNKEDYDTGIIRSAYGGRDNRGIDEKKPYCYIPSKLLVKISI